MSSSTCHHIDMHVSSTPLPGWLTFMTSEIELSFPPVFSILLFHYYWWCNHPSHLMSSKAWFLHSLFSVCLPKFCHLFIIVISEYLPKIGKQHLQMLSQGGFSLPSPSQSSKYLLVVQAFISSIFLLLTHAHSNFLFAFMFLYTSLQPFLLLCWL